MRTDTPMGLGDHLDELRRRLVIALLGLVPIFIIGLVAGPAVLEWLIDPLIDQLRDAGEPTRLQATSPLESFVAYLKVAFGIAVVVGFPWLVIQSWLFVAPGLFPREKRFVYFLIPLSVLLTIASVAFLFRVLLPISLYFLIVFGTGLAQTEVRHEPVDQATLDALRASKLVVLDADPAPDQLEPGMLWVNTARNELRVYLERRSRRTKPGTPTDVEPSDLTDPVQPLVGAAAQEAAGGADAALDLAQGADASSAEATAADADVAPREGVIRVSRLAGDGLISQDYRIGEYVSLVFRLAIVFAIAFQLPLVMLLLGWLDILRIDVIRRARRYVAFGCAVAGAVLTPQDPWSMVLLGGVLYLLFEFGLVLMRVVTPARVAGRARGRNDDPDASNRREITPADSVSDDEDRDDTEPQ